MRTGWIDRPRAKLDPAAAEFFRLAPEFADFVEWDDETEQTIWLMHAEGASRPEIMRAIGAKRPREVRTRLERLRERFEMWVRRVANHYRPEPDETNEIEMEFRRFGALL